VHQIGGSKRPQWKEALNENTLTEKGGEDNTDSGLMASNNNAMRVRVRARKKQKRKEGNTLIFDKMLSSTERAVLYTSGGPTILRVMEAENVSEMYG
jgi:hypothetical protein